MSWFWLAVTRKFADFAGRSRRREYWWSLVVMTPILVGAVIVDSVLGTLDESLGLGVTSGLLLLGLLIPGMALSVRRLHDIGRSGWWTLLGVTGIGSGVLMVIALFDSQPGSNTFGLDPKLADDGTMLDERPVSKFSKGHRVLIIVGGTAVLIAIMGFGLRHWFMGHMDNIKAQGKQYENAGQVEGRASSERNCFKSAIDRHTVNRVNDLTQNVQKKPATRFLPKGQ